MCCHFFLQGTFPTQRSNPSLLWQMQWQADSFLLVPPEKHLVGNSGNYLGHKFIISEEVSVVFLTVVFLNITFLPYRCFLTFSSLSLFSSNFLDVIFFLIHPFWGSENRYRLDTNFRVKCMWITLQVIVKNTEGKRAPE